MDNYHLKVSLKTKILNGVRTILTLPLLERPLAQVTLRSSAWYLHKLIPPDYLYSKGSIRHVSRNGINYELDLSHVVDHGIYYGIGDGGYDSVIDEIKNAKTIIDIGANIGSTALYFASLNPTAEIFAFEPHPTMFKKAQENIDRNAFKNIRLLNFGLADKKEKVKLFEVNENNPGMNRILSGDQKLPFITIQVERLDEIVLENKISDVGLIKIDVEGFEYSVLLGAQETIKRNKPVLFIELDDNNLRENKTSAKELLKLLVSLGYKTFYRADNLKSITLESNFENCHFDLVVKQE